MNEQKRRLSAACLARRARHVPRLGADVLLAVRAHEAGGNRMVRALTCLARVDRGAAKIEEGIYRFSEVSGREIPRALLEIVPDAFCTLDEEDEEYALEPCGEPGRLQ